MGGYLSVEHPYIVDEYDSEDDLLFEDSVDSGFHEATRKDGGKYGGAVRTFPNDLGCVLSASLEAGLGDSLTNCTDNSSSGGSAAVAIAALAEAGFNTNVNVNSDDFDNSDNDNSDHLRALEQLDRDLFAFEIDENSIVDSENEEPLQREITGELSVRDNQDTRIKSNHELAPDQVRVTNFGWRSNGKISPALTKISTPSAQSQEAISPSGIPRRQQSITSCSPNSSSSASSHHSPIDKIQSSRSNELQDKECAETQSVRESFSPSYLTTTRCLPTHADRTSREHDEENEEADDQAPPSPSTHQLLRSFEIDDCVSVNPATNSTSPLSSTHSSPSVEKQSKPNSVRGPSPRRHSGIPIRQNSFQGGASQSGHPAAYVISQVGGPASESGISDHYGNSGRPYVTRGMSLSSDGGGTDGDDINISDISGRARRSSKKRSGLPSAWTKSSTSVVAASKQNSRSCSPGEVKGLGLHLERKVLDLKRWYCMSRPQYKTSCGISSLVSCWNFLFSTLGHGNLTPLTQEAALTILGFRLPFSDIKFGSFTGNIALLRWFQELNANFQVKGKCYFMYKPVGKNRTPGVSRDMALNSIKSGLRDPNMTFIYHCENHYFCPIGYDETPKEPSDAYRANPNDDNETWILIGETSKLHPSIHCKSWSSICEDLNSRNPYYLDIRREWKGVQCGRFKKKSVMESASGESASTQDDKPETASVSETASIASSTPSGNPKAMKFRPGNLHCILAFEKVTGCSNIAEGGRQRVSSSGGSMSSRAPPTEPLCECEEPGPLLEEEQINISSFSPTLRFVRGDTFPSCLKISPLNNLPFPKEEEEEGIEIEGVGDRIGDNNLISDSCIPGETRQNIDDHLGSVREGGKQDDDKLTPKLNEDVGKVERQASHLCKLEWKSSERTKKDIMLRSRGYTSMDLRRNKLKNEEKITEKCRNWRNILYPVKTSPSKTSSGKNIFKEAGKESATVYETLKNKSKIKEAKFQEGICDSKLYICRSFAGKESQAQQREPDKPGTNGKKELNVSVKTANKGGNPDHETRCNGEQGCSEISQPCPQSVLRDELPKVKSHSEGQGQDTETNKALEESTDVSASTSSGTMSWEEGMREDQRWRMVQKLGKILIAGDNMDGRAGDKQAEELQRLVGNSASDNTISWDSGEDNAYDGNDEKSVKSVKEVSVEEQQTRGGKKDVKELDNPRVEFYDFLKSQMQEEKIRESVQKENKVNLSTDTDTGTKWKSKKSENDDVKVLNNIQLKPFANQSAQLPHRTTSWNGRDSTRKRKCSKKGQEKLFSSSESDDYTFGVTGLSASPTISTISSTKQNYDEEVMKYKFFDSDGSYLSRFSGDTSIWKTADEESEGPQEKQQSKKADGKVQGAAKIGPSKRLSSHGRRRAVDADGKSQPNKHSSKTRIKVNKVISENMKKQNKEGKQGDKRLETEQRMSKRCAKGTKKGGQCSEVIGIAKKIGQCSDGLVRSVTKQRSTRTQIKTNQVVSSKINESGNNEQGLVTEKTDACSIRDKEMENSKRTKTKFHHPTSKGKIEIDIRECEKERGKRIHAKREEGDKFLNEKAKHHKNVKRISFTRADEDLLLDFGRREECVNRESSREPRKSRALPELGVHETVRRKTKLRRISMEMEKTQIERETERVRRRKEWK